MKVVAPGLTRRRGRPPLPTARPADRRRVERARARLLRGRAPGRPRAPAGTDAFRRLGPDRTAAAPLDCPPVTCVARSPGGAPDAASRRPRQLPARRAGRREGLVVVDPGVGDGPGAVDQRIEAGPEAIDRCGDDRLEA